MSNSFVTLGLTLLISCVAALRAQSINQDEAFRHYTSEYFESPFKHIVVPSSNYRLNLTVKPLRYHLRMRPVLDDGVPNLPQYSVPSTVAIHAEAITNGSSITLHQRNLTIDLANVQVTNIQSGSGLSISNQTFEIDRDLYTIHLRDSFQFGDELEILIPFTVHLSLTENVGIYLGHYVDHETNETRYLSTTKLEPYHARKVFPLFDEPSLKARFSISVGRVDTKYHSLSNMEIFDTVRDPALDGWVWDNYEETVLMSPYLVCVIVSDFANDTVHIPEINRTVSTWAPKHDIEADGGSYGSSTGAKLLSFYEKRFKMTYALRKLDAVALPQFASGAMENFGLVTYRHAYLVWIPGENTEAERRKVTQVLAHEIVHQWYGNIVTCAWWSEIWLNEGFARYMQFWGMNDTLPEFLIEEAFVNDATQLAMVFDQGPLTHPVRNSAESPTESAAVFDRISYEKAASLLRMMEGFLGRELLVSGMVDFYLQKMQWKSAHQEDLFDSIQDAVVAHNSTHLLPPGIRIRDIMTEWTLTSGYPLVRVDAISSNRISISQEKFTLSSRKSEVHAGHWWVPVKILYSSRRSDIPDLWISNNVSAITFSRDDLDTNKMLMVNPDASGYYRVLYDPRLTGLIRRQLEVEHTVISSISRSQFLDDYFILAFGSYIQIESALQLTRYLGREMASNVWTAVLVHLKPVLAKFTEDSEALHAFQRYVTPRLEGALNLIGVRQGNNERGINVTLRAQLLDMACHLGLDACDVYAADLMNLWMKSPETNPFPTDLRATLYCTAIAKSDSLAWNFLLSRITETRYDAHKTTILNALACSKNLTTLSTFLETSLNTSSILHMHRDQVLTRVAMNPAGRSLVYEFAKINLLSSRISANTFASVVGTISSYWGKEDNAMELQQFMESNGDALEHVRASLETSLNTLKANVNWWGLFGRRIHTWLQDNF